MDFRVEINEADKRRVMTALDQANSKARNMIRNALNKVARKQRKELVQKARTTYAFKPGFRLGDITLHPASPGTLVATLEASERERSMRQYKTRVLKGGVKAAQLKKGPIDFLGEKGRRAFMGRGRLSELIVQREQRGHNSPLKVPMGSSKSKMFEMAWKGGGEGGFEPMPPGVQQELHAELEARMREVL